MATRQPHRDRQDSQTGEQTTEIQRTARRYGLVNLVAGLLGLVGPLVWGNDDDLITVESGQFLGLIAVNGPHAALHALHGAHGLRAGRDAASARRYVGLSGAFFALFAAVGIRKFGFDTGVHHVAGLAVDGYGNAGHVVLSAFAFLVLLQNDESS